MLRETELGFLGEGGGGGMEVERERRWFLVVGGF